MRYRLLPLFLLLLLFPAGARSQTNSSGGSPDYGALRRQADAAAAKWNPAAKLYLAELLLRLGVGRATLDSTFYYVVPLGNNAWSKLTVGISDPQNTPPGTPTLTTEEASGRDSLYGAPPTAAPATQIDPLAGLQKLYGNVSLPQVVSDVRLVQIGNKNPAVMPDGGYAENSLGVDGKFGSPGEWVWYAINTEQGGDRLALVDAVTGQGSMVCALGDSHDFSQPCPAVAPPRLPQGPSSKVKAQPGPASSAISGSPLAIPNAPRPSSKVSPASVATSSEGDWQGTLVARNGNLPLIFHLSAGDSGMVDSPAQKFSAPLQYTANGNQITITVSSINAIYAATVNGNQMSGTWSQNGRNTTLTVTKQSQPGSGLFNSQGSQRVRCNEQGKNCRPVN